MTSVDPCRRVTTAFREAPQRTLIFDGWQWDSELRQCNGPCHPEDGMHNTAILTIGGKPPAVLRPRSACYPLPHGRRARALTV